MLRRCLFVLTIALATSLAGHRAAADERPNVVVLLADDLGWTGLRCFGSDFYETPHLDQLAADGMKFTQAYAACTVCSPTRASLMTGMYPARLRLTDFIAGQNPSVTFDRNLYWHYPHYHAGGDGPYSAIRSGDYRLIEFHEDERVELYDLATDIGEQNNLAGEQPAKASELQQQLGDWRQSIDAQMPTPNPNYDEARATNVARSRR